MLLHLDPAISSDNIGDQIITKYISRILIEHFNYHEIISVPTQLFGHSRRLARLIKQSDLILLGGSNLLSGRYPRIHQWANIHQFSFQHANVISFGAGWHSYEKKTNILASKMIRNALHPNLNSVRDEYTKKKLASLGIDSLNTGCPTLWNLKSVYHQNTFNKIVFTFTYYRKDFIRDRQFLIKLDEVATKFNASLTFWPQSTSDLDYFNQVSDNDFSIVKILNPTLNAFEDGLEDAVYIGTRLHAGIHALNLGCSAFIYELDNRSIEMSNSFHLPTFRDINDIDLETERVIFNGFNREIANNFLLRLNSFGS